MAIFPSSSITTTENALELDGSDAAIVLHDVVIKAIGADFSGIVSAFGAALDLSVYGSVAGAFYGVHLVNGGNSVQVGATGMIFGSAAGIFIGNAGDGGGSNSVLNAGSIASWTGAAIRIAAAGDNHVVSNSGSLSGVFGIALHHNLSSGAAISNTGSILVSDTAITVAGTKSWIANSGTIQAGRIGIELVNATEDPELSNRIINTGTIQAATAIAGSQTTDEVTNAGRIVGNIELGLGDDTYDGQQGTVEGIVDLGEGDDVAIGGAGSEVFRAGLGDDFIDGGAGIDTIDYTGSGAVKVNLSQRFQFTGSAGADQLIGIENVRGGDGADVIVGSAGTNELEGGQGDDTIEGGAGIDALDGGDGLDTVRFTGSKGVTVDLTGGFAIVGTDFNTADALLGFENVIGGAGGDYIAGTEGDNVLDGGAGNDTILGGGEDYDQDMVRGGLGNDVLSGGIGYDTLDGGVGNDVLDGGTDFDWVEFKGSAGAIVDLRIRGAQDTGYGRDTIRNVEALIGGRGKDRLTGDGKDNELTGNDGNDTLAGGTGNDRLIGGKGNDILDGGTGNDTVDFSGAQRALVLTIGQRTASADGTDTLISIENVFGGSKADRITGDKGANRLRGAEGDDTLDGGAGNDTIGGGQGDDVLKGGDGFDTLDYRLFRKSDNTPFVIVLQDGAVVQGEGADRIEGFEGVVGSYSRDDITGDARANRLDGYLGSDTIAGGDGADTLVGGQSNDILDGGAGDDILVSDHGSDVLDGGEGFDTVDYSARGENLNYDLGALTSIEAVIGGSGADVFAGTAEANRLDGGSGADKLSGGGGADTLVGGLGKDELTGGADADVFVFRAKGESALGTSRDVILDFATGIDKIDLSAIDANEKLAGNQAFAVFNTGDLTVFARGVTGQLFYNAVTNILSGETNGDGKADFEISLANGVVARLDIIL